MTIKDGFRLGLGYILAKTAVQLVLALVQLIITFVAELF